MGERDGLKSSGPTKTAETVVAFFVPPACREEVLGDLYERCGSPGRYWFDAIRTVPLVIASRVRRTSVPQVLATLALGTYAAFLGAAFFWDRAFLHGRWGLLSLAIPVVPVLVALMLDDAYAKPGRRSPLQSIRGAVLGLGLAWLLQVVLWAGARDLAVPSWLMLYGGAMSLLLISALRMLLPQATNQAASGPSLAFAPDGEPVRLQHGSIFVLKVLAVVMIGVLLREWKVDVSPGLVKPFIGVAAAALILRELNRRA